jgi:hypothetical protein
MESEGASWARALAALVRATLAAARGEDRTIELLRSAHASLLAADMRLHAACAERRLGEALGGDEGRARVAAANAWFASKGVRNATAMVGAIAPCSSAATAA